MLLTYKNNNYKQKDNQQQQSSNSDLPCDYCLRRGHDIERKRALTHMKPREQASFIEEPDHLMFTAHRPQLSRHHFIIDSGATSHLTCRRDWLHDFNNRESPRSYIFFP
jgi:hypothetical protein